MFDKVDTAFGDERDLFICSFLQDISKEKGSSLQLLCNTHTAFLLCGGAMRYCNLPLRILGIQAHLHFSLSNIDSPFLETLSQLNISGNQQRYRKVNSASYSLQSLSIHSNTLPSIWQTFFSSRYKIIIVRRAGVSQIWLLSKWKLLHV